MFFGHIRRERVVVWLLVFADWDGQKNMERQSTQRDREQRRNSRWMSRSTTRWKKVYLPPAILNLLWKTNEDRHEDWNTTTGIGGFNKAPTLNSHVEDDHSDRSNFAPKNSVGAGRILKEYGRVPYQITVTFSPGNKYSHLPAKWPYSNPLYCHYLHTVLHIAYCTRTLLVLRKFDYSSQVSVHFQVNAFL